MVCRTVPSSFRTLFLLKKFEFELKKKVQTQKNGHLQLQMLTADAWFAAERNGSYEIGFLRTD